MSQNTITQMPLRLPRSLHFQLKAGALHEGVSLNQYCLYLLAAHARPVKAALTQKAEDALRFIAQAQGFQRELEKGKKAYDDYVRKHNKPRKAYQ